MASAACFRNGKKTKACVVISASDRAGQDTAGERQSQRKYFDKGSDAA